MPQLNAILINPVKRSRQDIGIMLPDRLYEFLTDKKYTIEIVDLQPDCHSIYVCDNEQDIISTTFNPQLADAVKIAFKTINDKLLSDNKELI